jgi:hypothetical protein
MHDVGDEMMTDDVNVRERDTPTTEHTTSQREPSEEERTW